MQLACGNKGRSNLASFENIRRRDMKKEEEGETDVGAIIGSLFTARAEIP